jgi:two-component system, NtrC family, response regulator AtoC
MQDVSPRVLGVNPAPEVPVAEFLPGTSPAALSLERAAREVADSAVPILILGEAGAGKRTLAARIHCLSSLRAEPFREVRCADLTPAWFMSRTESEPGSLSGTWLLTEVTELPTVSQSKLLSWIDEQATATQISSRIILSSRGNLEEELRTGRFREDLYYRISGVCLRIPPLRHRREDIPLLTDYFLARYLAVFGHAKPAIGEDMRRFLREYSWPNNVRELEEATKTIAAIGDERLALAALKAALVSGRQRDGNGTISLKQAGRAASQEAEKELILEVLTRTRWNRKRAALELQISYKALLYKLKQIGVKDSLA